MLRRLFAPRKRHAPTPRPFVQLHVEELEKREMLDGSVAQGLGFLVFSAYQTAREAQQVQGVTQTALNQFYSDSASYKAGKGATSTQVIRDKAALQQDANIIQQLNSTFHNDSEFFIQVLLGTTGSLSSDDTDLLLVEAYFLIQGQSLVNSALQTATEASSVTSPATTQPGPGPAIGSLTANPNPMTAGSSETLTASNVTDGNGTITQVAFYLDSNNDGTLEPGTDQLLGDATQTSPGVWTGTANTPVGTPAGTYKLFAQAQDSNGTLSAPVAATLTVSSGGPQPKFVIGSFTANPNPVTAGSSETLTASNVTDGNGTITQVAFYLDSNNDGTLEPGTDQLLGDATQTSPGVWTGTANIPAGTPAGTYKLFAQAQDNSGTLSTPIAATLTVSSGSTQGGPAIGSFTTSPNPVAAGSSETLTASNVTDSSSTIKQVAFYLDSNNDGTLEPGTDQLLGDATQTSPGVWTGTANTPAGTPAGTYKLFAQAQDNSGTLSTPITATLTVSSGSTQSGGPVIGSFTINPNPVTAGSSVTLTEPNITDNNSNAIITQVAFYLDSNNDGILEPGTDQLLGDATQTSPGVWTLINSSTFGLTAGAYKLFARAEDNDGAFSYPVALTLTVSSGSTQPGGPAIGSFTANPNPVAAGSSETLTASNVTDSSSTIKQVAFYLDSNNDGTLEPGTDQLLGDATQTSPGVWTGTANTPANTPAGTYKLFAQAQDNSGTLSTPIATTLTVQ